MFDKIRYSFMRVRFTQLICIYLASLLLFMFTTIPHSSWIYSTVVVLLAVNNPGILYQKSFERGIGTIYGVVLFVPFIYLMQINYKLIPVALIIFAVLTNSTSPKRADIMVMLMTLALFTLSALNVESAASSLDGVIETMIKRFICTFIGIFLCVVGDFWFFKRFNYTTKLYRFHQLEAYRALTKHMNMVIKHDRSKFNRFILIDRLRNNLNQIFLNIGTSGDGVKLSYSANLEDQAKVKKFSSTIWQMRKMVFATYYAKFVSDDETIINACKLKFKNLKSVAQENFIPSKQIKRRKLK